LCRVEEVTVSDRLLMGRAKEHHATSRPQVTRDEDLPLKVQRVLADKAKAGSRRHMEASGLVELQRLAGNQAVAQLIASQRIRSMAGDQADEAVEAVLGGNTGTTTLDESSAEGGSLGGDATSMSTSDLSAPEWGDYGKFKWWIKWVTNGTKGWIVQKIDNTYSGELSDGTPITNASVGVTPSYYEAWEVSPTGDITGSLGGTGNRDRWERPPRPTGSQGSWGMTGTAYWTSKDPAASGFTSGGVSNAGSLLSSTSAPAGLSAALLTRKALGAWDKSGAKLMPGCLTF
jgi:hypothetical protein